MRFKPPEEKEEAQELLRRGYSESDINLFNSKGKLIISSQPMIYQKGFRDFQMGYASAMAWMLLLAVGLVTAVLFRTSRSWVFYNDGSNS